VFVALLCGFCVRRGVYILLVAVIGLSRQSHDFDENKHLDQESTINFPLIDRLFP